MLELKCFLMRFYFFLLIIIFFEFLVYINILWKCLINLLVLVIVRYKGGSRWIIFVLLILVNIFCLNSRCWCSFLIGLLNFILIIKFLLCIFLICGNCFNFFSRWVFILVVFFIRFLFFIIFSIVIVVV